MSDRPSAGPAVFLGGGFLLAVALLAALLLVLQHFGGLSLPGCGPQSACSRATGSVWGKVPLLDWPLAHAGLAYFAGLLAAWLVTRGQLPPSLRWLSRLGVLGSLMWIAVMFAGGYLCAYCLTVHAANIAFVGLVELGAPAPAGQRRGAVSFGAVLVVATVALAVSDSLWRAAVEEKQEQERAASEREILEKVASHNPHVALVEVSEQSGPSDATTGDAVFTGRYREGPEVAAIRVVIFSDYQCPDCRDIEAQAVQILSKRSDVSFSPKHFPMCADCNPLCRERNFSPHPNACRAARAAEAVGILGGNEAFFAMHRWLFERKGRWATVAELREGVEGSGVDFESFIEVLESKETLEPILEDIEEALELGLRFTPMIFVNGVELKGFQAKKALIKTVNAVVAKKPLPLTASVDRPPRAQEKYVADWREGFRWRRPPPDTQDWTRGPVTAAVDIVIWGDYLEPICSALDTRVRRKIANMPSVRYSFRHFPANQECNPSTEITRNELTCRAAKAVEAAGRVGGLDAYWAVHEWLMENQNDFSDATLIAAIAALGLDPAAVFAEMESSAVAEAIRLDARAARRAGLHSIPLFYVNGRRVPTWQLEGQKVPELIIEAAAVDAKRAR